MTNAAYVCCAKHAQIAGYDGVEIMGSEGYLINQFIAPQTNFRDDAWGGSFLNRIRFPVAIVRRTREAVGPNFIIIYRLSMLDLVEGGSTWDEVVALAQAIEGAGATMINTGIGWHEARIPTIATMVPRAAFAWVTRRMKSHVKLPLITTNRINDPATAETVRYFRTRLAHLGARVELNRRVGAEDLGAFDDVILATGIVPRVPAIPGIDHPKVASYVEIVEGRKVAGKRVAIIGAGGIGF